MAILDDENIHLHAAQDVSPKVIEDIRGTTAWMKLVSIVGFIFSGLIALASLILLSSQREGISQAMILLVMALIGTFLSFILLQYANNLHEYAAQRNPDTMTEAMSKFKTFWLFCGVLGLIYLILMIFGLLIATFARS